MLKPNDFFDAVAEYDKTVQSDESKGHMRFATIDSAYAGNGPARVKFDGETSLSNKAYPFVHAAPTAGARVLMTPVSNTYVINGMLNGGA